MSSSLAACALIAAGLVGGVVMFMIGGSRRISHTASLVLTWSGPAFCVACFLVAGAVRTGSVANIAVALAWSVVAAVGLAWFAGWLPRRKADHEDR